MALSDYDCLSFGPDGNPGDGSLRGVREPGQVFQIYKCYATIEEKLEGDEYRRWGVVNGSADSVRIGDFQISTRLDADGAFYAYVSSSMWDEEKKELVTRRMAGVGCYGWENEAVKLAKDLGVDVDDPDIDFLSAGWIGDQIELYVHMKDGHEHRKYGPVPRADYEPQYVGVTTEMVRRLRGLVKEWIPDWDMESQAWYDSWDDNGKRFCQGNAYFGVQDGTEPGLADTPLLMQALRAMGGPDPGTASAGDDRPETPA
jgi:hypothetical protein